MCFNGFACLLFMSEMFYKAHWAMQLPSRGNKAFCSLAEADMEWAWEYELLHEKQINT